MPARTCSNAVSGEDRPASVTGPEEQPRALPPEPVLAQLPLGAPGRGYWIAIGVLVWLVASGLLASLRPWSGPSAAPPLAASGAGPAAFILIVAWAGLLGAFPFPYLIRLGLARLGGVQPRVRWHRGSPHVYADRPLGRAHALTCLAGPAAVLTLVGMLGMTRAPYLAEPFLASIWARFAFDLSLAGRLLREPGCTRVLFRRDGFVLYGSGRPPRPRTREQLWVSSLVIGAAWSALLFPLLARSGRGAGPVIAGLLLFLTGTVLIASVRVRRLQRRAEEEERRRLALEVDEAHRMQQSLLPAAAPRVAGVEVATLFQAAHEVSGDFYLFPEAPPGAVRVVLGDVAGKGMPAALTAALAVGFLRAGAAAEPAAQLETAGRALRAARQQRTMVAACAVEVEGESRRLRWCNAGLPPAALLREGAVRWLPGAGVPLGSMAQASYRGHEERLEPGDLLLFYTDGLLEATGPLGEMFGRRRLAAAVARLPDGCGPAEALERLQGEVTQFIGDTEPYDDITAVALTVA